jgi:hypothetical protein
MKHIQGKFVDWYKACKLRIHGHELVTANAFCAKDTQIRK